MSAQIITQGWGAGLGIPVTVALSPFPNVPALPGVPQLARSLLSPASAPPTIGTQATSGALWQSTQSEPVWGIFDADGNNVTNADSVYSFDWRQENRIPNFPIQQGQFGTYNRVGLPGENAIKLIKGGSESDRALFLQQIDAIIAQQNIQLYTVRTPEKSYTNVSATLAELSRVGKDGAFWFEVELRFIQINQITAQYSNSTTPTNNASVPSAIPTTNQGLTQGSTPSSAVQAAASSAVASPNPELNFLNMLAE